MEIGSRDWKDLIVKGAARLGLPLGEEAVDQFAVYADELIAWNRRINLTAITAPADMAIKHFLDSIAPLPHLPARGVLLDVGTGGGFPGLPLKIAAPELTVTLVDASRKKVNFLKHVIRTLDLKKIDALQARSEDLPGRDGFSGRFDVVVCRAYSSLKQFAAQARPLLASGGIMLAFKGREVDLELAVPAPQGDIQAKTANGVSGLADLDIEVFRYRLPYADAQRALILMKLRARG